MKKLLSLLLISFLLVFTVSCNCGGSAASESSETGNVDNSDSTISRIKFIEKYNVRESIAVYEIISVDGKEYLCNSRGGIYPLVTESQPDVTIPTPTSTY